MESERVLPIVALIPVSALEGAKSRLGEVLDPEERRELVEALLLRTIDAALAAPAIDEVLVVSPDQEGINLAGQRGCSGVIPATRGLKSPIPQGQAPPGKARPGPVRPPGLTPPSPGGRPPRETPRRVPFGLLVLPADLPRIDASAIEAIVAAAAPEPSVTLVPDLDREGTNALLVLPAGMIEPAFGIASRAAHEAVARAAGATYREVVDSPLARDIDTPADLIASESDLPDRVDVA